MEQHLENLPRSLKDKKSSETGFRKMSFWKPTELDLIIRLMPLWMKWVESCPEKNDLGGGEMVSNTEEIGYRLILVGPLIDFYLRLLAKRILGKMRLNYESGQIKIIGVTCPSNIWWYLAVLAKKYGTDAEFNITKIRSFITINAMSTFKALFSPQRVGKVVFEKKNFKRSKVILEDGQTKKISKFVGKSKILCDPDHPAKFIYKNGNIRLIFFLQKYNNLNVATNVTLVG